MAGRIKLVAFDLDGVLYRGSRPVPGAREALEYLDRRGLQVRFVTNNSTMHRSEVARKLSDMGLPAETGQVVGSAWAAARYVAGRLAAGEAVLYVGEEGLGRELREAGLPAEHVPGTLEELHAYEARTTPVPGAVAVGLDRSFTYWGLAAAQHAVLSGALFVATNADVTIPTEHGVLPGGGSVVAAVAACTSVEPVVVGKPGLAMAEVLAEASGVPSGETLFVGDRIETDIAFGLGAGMVTALVLTGVATREDLAAAEVTPHFVLDDLFGLPESLEAED
jgi:4-nitrophenyl phosphatase